MLFCVDWVLRITELIRFIGIFGVTSVLRFISTLSNTRAGLNEAACVLGGSLWSSGLCWNFDCLGTMHKVGNDNTRDCQTIDSTQEIITLPSRNAYENSNRKNSNNPKTANEVKAPYNHNNPSNPQ